MSILPVDAVHPHLIQNYNRLKDIADKRKGLLGGYSVLHTYLAEQLEVLKHCDVMFGHDFGTDPRVLMNYSVGELHEVVEEIPIFSLQAKDKHVDGPASLEAGDVAWFLGMRVGLAQLNPSEHSLSSDEERLIVGMLKIFEALNAIYPEFNPEKHAGEVAEKNKKNYPDRVLRAEPNASISEMSQEFSKVRLPILKEFRSQLPERKIPIHVHDAIQNANPEMPSVEFSKPDAPVKYRQVLVYAQDASKYYAY